jgi:hypothetical protein
MSKPHKTAESVIKNDHIFYCMIRAQAFEHFLIVVSSTVKEELVSFLESFRYALHVILTLKIELQSKGFGA